MTRPESTIQNKTRALFSYIGPNWRNNSGAFKDETGRVIRFGLGNESKKLNEKFKSSDVIGITPVLITPEMVGQVLGVFTALECKPEGWKQVPSDKRAIAQANFHDIVRKHGGFAGFVSDPNQIYDIVGRKR